jgi:hypothetical protein
MAEKRDRHEEKRMEKKHSEYVGRTRRPNQRKWAEKVPRRVKKREIRKVRQLIDLKGLCHERNFVGLKNHVSSF